jgi:hypothetical protein
MIIDMFHSNKENINNKISKFIYTIDQVKKSSIISRSLPEAVKLTVHCWLLSLHNKQLTKINTFLPLC